MLNNFYTKFSILFDTFGMTTNREIPIEFYAYVPNNDYIAIIPFTL